MAESIPIAIIGMSCRFPGGISSPENLWNILEEGRCTWSDVPPDRFNWKAYYNEDPEMNGTTHHRGGHYLHGDVAAFDARFFGVSAADAIAIDPQQRLQLETTYEALESAGIPLDSIRGSRTSVFMATFNHDYENIIYRDLTELPKYAMTGTGQALAANRLSYIFDLRGPSFALDTGCSGSLVALHQACKSLSCGESDLSLVGGTNLTLSPEVLSPMSNLHVLNKDGKCYSFDSRGSGYGRGEGSGVIVLKRLNDALAAGDPIRAVIRNTASNQDGKTNGITFPNSAAQEDLIRFAYSSANLDPDDTGYVEAHGTGTLAGDKAEIDAIGKVFGNRNPENPLYIGSVKGNIGHLENASGIAGKNIIYARMEGVIKTVLVLERSLLPTNANLKNLKPELDLKGGRIEILRKLEQWSNAEGRVRRASVNSFGYGGTNAHAILESYSANSAPSTKSNATMRISSKKVMSPRLFVLSAKSEKSLAEAIQGLYKWAKDHRTPDDWLADLAHTLSLRRSIMQWRFTFVASSAEGIEDILSASKHRLTKAASARPVVFLCSGQGAQYAGMARELCRGQSRFLESLEESERILKQLGASWDLVTELVKETATSRLHESEIGQPASTAVQIALIDQLHHLNIKPTMVLGHSSGEIAAAYAAGALSQRSAMTVSYRRSFLAQHSKLILKSKGAMLAVGLGESQILNQYPLIFRKRTITVACVNSPSSTTVSGDELDVLNLKEALDRDSIFNRLLKVDTAYHSHHMRVVAEKYLKSMSGLESGSTDPGIEFYSSVTGERKVSGFEPSYWVENLVSQVNFSDALAELCTKQHLNLQKTAAPYTPLFLEIGASSTLSSPFRQTVASLELPKFTPLYFPSLVRNENSMSQLLNLVGRVLEEGCEVDLKAVAAISQTSACKVLTDLPSYSWDHTNTYWNESRLSKELRFRKSPYHNLLGLRVAGSTAIEPIWRHNIHVDRHAWLKEHVVDDLAIFPAASYISMAIQAMQQTFAEKNQQEQILNYVLKNVTFLSALMIPEAPGKIEIQLSLIARAEGNGKSLTGWREFLISSISSDGSCTENCRGSILAELKTPTEDTETSREKNYTVAAQLKRLNDTKKILSTTLDSTSLYQELQSTGNAYGTHFRVIKEYSFAADHTSACGTATIQDMTSSISTKEEPHVIHPTTLDAFLHSTIPLYTRSDCASGSIVIASFEELTISARILNEPGHELSWVTSVAPNDSRSAVSQLVVFQSTAESTQEPVISISNLLIRSVNRTTLTDSSTPQNRDMSYQLKWEPDIGSVTSVQTNQAVANKSTLSPEKKLHLLDKAAALYIDSCLKKLTEDDLSQCTPELLAFHNWTIRFLDSKYARDLISDMSEAEIKVTFEEAQLAGIEGQAVCLVGPNLKYLLTGWMNPLSLLLHHDLLYRLYADESSSRCYTHLINYMKSLVFKKPQMKILELGGGTGGLTLPLLQALDNQGSLPLANYTFTDISSGFFENAKEKFQSWEKYMQFKVLDINGDLEAQGFEKETYDVIVASNVLHIPQCVGDTLKDVRALLKPGGTLLMIETIRVVPFYNMLFGALPGWFIGANDGRPDSPLMTPEQWNDVLLKSSFNGVEIIAFDYEGAAKRSAMMASRALKDVGLTVKMPWEIIAKAEVKSKYSTLVDTLLRGLKSQKRGAASSSWPLKTLDADIMYILIDDGDNPILSDISDADFESIKMLLTQGKRNVLWITVQNDGARARPEKELVRGFARTARIENKNLTLVTLHAQLQATPLTDFIQKVSDILDETFESNLRDIGALEREYAFKNGKLFIPRLLPDTKMNLRLQTSDGPPEIKNQIFHQRNRPLKLHVETPGVLESICFVHDPSNTIDMPADEIEIRVMNCGISLNDVFSALGQMKAEMAGEYSGVVERVGSNLQGFYKIGDQVCGLAASSYASYIRVKDHNAYHIPSTISPIISASIPLAFTTAYHALIEIGHLEKGQTVLIHSASGAVGQAALQIAQYVTGPDMIFATVGNVEKRQFLLKHYNLSEDNIFSNRTRTFKQGILRLTKGVGVNVILNSLSGEALKDTWACTAKYGTFVEIGKSNIMSRSQLGMEQFDKGVTFSAFDMVDIWRERPALVKKLMKQVLSLFETGVLKPIQPIRVMPFTEIVDAFKLIQARKHNGKLVLQATDETVVPVAQAKETLQLRSNGTYVIAGGLGGLGLEIARFLANRGAKHLVLLSRRKFKDQALCEEFSSLGVESFHVACCDITSKASVEELALFIKSSMPPVRGIIQSAMVLKDALLEGMTIEDFKIPLQTKVRGTKLLIEAFSGPYLDSFIMLSSLVSVLGNSAQANYSAGNAFLDAVANSSNSTNTHFMSLNLGAMADVGVVAENPKLGEYLVRQGYILVKLSEFLTVLEYAMSSEAKSDDCHQIIMGFNRTSMMESQNSFMMENPMLGHLPFPKPQETASSQATVRQNLEESIANAKDEDEVKTIIATAIATKISALLSIDLEVIDLDAPLPAELDSLIMIEIRHWIADKFQKVLHVTKILDAPSFSGLAEIIMKT